MKRFWSSVEVVTGEAGYAIRLDARPVRTPGRYALEVPTRPLAEALAAEWDAQTDEVRPEAMPVTRACNTAIERVAPQRGAVAAEVASYGETDLLCYRAPAPEGLKARQAAAWDPLLAWAAETHGARLVVTEGVMHVDQPAPALAALAARVGRFGAFELTALHEMVTLTGSLVLGLATADGRLAPGGDWTLMCASLLAPCTGRDDGPPPVATRSR